MPGFDIKSAVPITDQGGVATKEPEFDINTALQLTEPIDSEDGFDAFQRSQLHKTLQDAINRPITEHEAKFIQDAETRDPGALRSFLIPYTEGVVGFFTKPFGYRPDLTRPFGLKEGAKTEAEKETEATMAKGHPVSFTLGQVVAGIAPFIATAPLFPQSLLGTLGTFETVGLTRKIGQIRTEESLLMPPIEKGKELGIEAIKSGVMAPAWVFSAELQFIGRPFLSAMVRAGVRGTAVAGLETVFGTDLHEALKQGGIITALSLIFEAPALAKTALGRGIINRANEIAEAKGLTEPKYIIDVDKLDATHTRVGLFDMVKAFYSMMRTKIEKVGMPPEPARQATYDRLAYAPEMPPPKALGGVGAPIWAPMTPTTPKAGGMAFKPQKAPIFYSKMAGSLAEKMPESAPVEQVRGILQSSGIPKEEIEWSGIEEFLKSKDKVGKTELLDYLSKNQMTIEESIKEGTSYPERLKQIEDIFTAQGFSIGKEMGGEILVTENATDRDIPPDEFEKTHPDLMELAGEYTALKGEFEKEIPKEMPKYADTKYNVVTDNYKEMLLKMPTPDLTKQIAISEKIGKWDYSKLHEGIYKEPHWEEPNVFAHARIADVMDEQGRKGLFVNEIQSQWALQARKEGFIGEATENQIKEVMQEYSMNRDEAIESIQKGQYGKIPYHPVVSRWHEIILKRLLRYAAENGYDFITWATGEQVAEYYNLAKYVDAIRYRKIKGTYDIDLIKDGNVIEGKTQIPAEELERYTGKEVAQRIIKGEGKKKADMKELSGEGLKVGGAWAINLYDKQIPNWLNDYAKKFGAQVETVEIKSFVKQPDDFKRLKNISQMKGESTQQSLAITPQMKQALLGEGQPVFGKMPKEVGKPGLEAPGIKIFRMDEEAKIVNTKGEIVTLPKGEEYHTLPVLDSEGNVVPNKVKLTDGKQVTVYEGELNKLKGKILGEGEQPIAGGKAQPPVPVKGQPPEKPREKQRKEEMVLWNTPEITEKLLKSEQDFLKKYIDENKSLKQIAKELGENIEDIKKTEMWTYAHMQEIVDELSEEIEEAGGQEVYERKNELKAYLTGKLNPGLKTKGEYSQLKHLPWLWAKEGEGVGADTLTELSGMGFPVESEADIIGLIETYFKKEIEGRAAEYEVKYVKARQVELKRGLKPKKVKPEAPEREITGVGNGSVISTKEDENGEEKTKIFKGMPFALLGNKARVLARLPRKFKAVLKQGIKKVFDLFGGAKGYRVGLFPELPAIDYNLNELSNERYNYYKNIQDPEKQKIMKQTLDNIITEFTSLMNDAFGLPVAKNDEDFMDMLNSWLKMGLKNERYYFAREVIRGFWNKLRTEAEADKFVSPESSAKYFFMENVDIYQAQGILRKEKGNAYILDVLDKLEGLGEKLDIEAKRDSGMPTTQEDAWEKMDKLTTDIRSGKINPKETVVLIDPQYLNPTEEAGTYAVGVEDTTWEGHQANLGQHLLPLIKTGVKIIYTNNADQNLIKWLQAHKLPYNIEKSVGAVAERRGRDEIISFIGFGLGPEWTVGRVQPAGAGTVSEGPQYVAPRVTGESAKFTEWLEKQEQVRLRETKGQELMDKIHKYAKKKNLSDSATARLIKIFTGQPKKEPLTEEEAATFVKGVKGVVPGYGGRPPKIPLEKSLVPVEFYQKKIGKPGAEQYLFEPHYMFKRLGLWSEVGKPIYDAQDSYEKNVQEKLYTLRQWLKKAGRGKEISQRIWELADGTIEAEDLLKMTDDQKKIAEQWRDLAEEYADKLGLPIEERQPNYISHLVEDLFRQYLKDKYPFPEDLVAAMESKFFQTKKIFDPYLQERLGFPIVKKDFWTSALSYIRAAERKLAFDPVLQQVNAYISKGLLPAETVKYIKDVIDYQILGRPTPTDKMVFTTLQNISNWLGTRKVKLAPDVAEVTGMTEIEVPWLKVPGKPMTKAIAVARNLSYMSLIAGNIRTMVVNLTQTVGTLAKLKGWPHQTMYDMAIGHLASLKLIFSPKGWELMRKTGVMDVDINTFLEGNTPQWQVTGNYIKDLMFWNMKFSEFQNRVSSAFAGARNKIRAGDTKGLVLINPKLSEEAILLDKELSDLINFRYGALWRPTSSIDPIGQLIYHLNSFNFKQLQLLHQLSTDMNMGKWGKNWQRDFKEDPIEFLKSLGTDDRGAFLRFILYGTLITILLGIRVGKSGILDVRISETPLWKLFVDLITLDFKGLKTDWKGLIPFRGAVRRIHRIWEEGLPGVLATGKPKEYSY